MPGTRCAIASCNNSLLKTKKNPDTSDVKYFSFPKKKEVKDKWIQVCKRVGVWNPENARVCSVHFQEADFKRNLRDELLNLPSKKVLNLDAIPTLGLPGKQPRIDEGRAVRCERRERKKLVNDILSQECLDDVPEVHFEDSQFEKNIPSKLKPNAIPTIFPEHPKPKKRCQISDRNDLAHRTAGQGIKIKTQQVVCEHDFQESLCLSPKHNIPNAISTEFPAVKSESDLTSIQEDVLDYQENSSDISQSTLDVLSDSETQSRSDSLSAVDFNKPSAKRKRKSGKRYCSAINCSVSKEKGISMFKFPIDDLRCSRWVRFCRRLDLIGKDTIALNKSYQLCAKHFELNQFMNKDRKRLVHDAVPTIFSMPDPSKKPLTSRRKPQKEGKQLKCVRRTRKILNEFPEDIQHDVLEPVTLLQEIPNNTTITQTSVPDQFDSEIKDVAVVEIITWEPEQPSKNSTKESTVDIGSVFPEWSHERALRGLTNEEFARHLLSLLSKSSSET